jgi:hypothetical protein
MAILKEAERNEKSASLKALRTQALNSIAILKQVKINISNLKTVVTNDTTNFDANDVTDVQSIIDEITTEIATI